MYHIQNIFKWKISNHSDDGALWITAFGILTLCVPCIVSKYVNKTNKMLSFFTYLFYNLYIHSTCFERSYLSSSGVFVVYCIHSSVQNRANLSSCFGFLVVTIVWFLYRAANTVNNENSWWWKLRSIETCRVDIDYRINIHKKSASCWFCLHNIVDVTYSIAVIKWGNKMNFQ